MNKRRLCLAAIVVLILTGLAFTGTLRLLFGFYSVMLVGYYLGLQARA